LKRKLKRGDKIERKEGKWKSKIEVEKNGKQLRRV